MAELDLEAIKARVAKAWETLDPGQSFALTARHDVPALLAEVERLKAENASLREFMTRESAAQDETTRVLGEQLAAARRDLEAATRFDLGEVVVQHLGSVTKPWAVTIARSPSLDDDYFATRDEALARARAFASVDGREGVAR